MFKVSPASLQTFIDISNCVLEDRVQYSTVHIPNVFCDGHLLIISCVGIVRHVHRDFLITLYNDYIRYNLRLMIVPFFYRHSETKPETFKDILMITKS
jgi:hypothetical protein